MGPIRMMIVEHQRTKAIAEQIELTSKNYLETNDPADLILTLEVYVQHVTEHLWKENNRLFKMADARLNNNAKDVDKNLEEIEEKKTQRNRKNLGLIMNCWLMIWKNLFLKLTRKFYYYIYFNCRV